MGYAKPRFPSQLWNGLSANNFRPDLSVDQWPNHQDWDQIVAEVRAMQLRMLAAPQQYEIELYEALTHEPVATGQPIYVRADSTVGVASHTTGRVAGIALVTAGGGEPTAFIPRGRVYHPGWSFVPGIMYYLGAGLVDPAPPDTGWVVQLGTAITSQILDLSIAQAIRL